ncbi:MAG TPA: putative inorganic carbon transporter subunit DabA, partial [Bryobacteraceae bacterium]
EGERGGSEEIFQGLSRHSLRRAMMTPVVREFDAATVMWRAEQGDLARDFRQPALRALFDACLARAVAHEEEPAAANAVNEVIHPWLIRLCSVFLDQGMAYWRMPKRDTGFYLSVRTLWSRPLALFPKYLTGLDDEFRRQEYMGFTATDSVLDYLDAQRFHETEWEQALQAELLALPGWAGLMRRLEKDPALAPHETVPCSLMDFLAVRFTMARVAARMGAADYAPPENPLKTEERRRLSRAARLYDAARVVSLPAAEIKRLPEQDWATFVQEVRAFNGLARRRIFQLAYERWHEREILGGLASHRRYRGLSGLPTPPAAQVFFCIDEREESMRRALEEADPEVETFSAAGFFGVAVNYRGIDEPHGAALAPVLMKPKHAVVEQPTTEDSALLEKRLRRRRILGRLMQHSFLSSKTLVRGWISTSALGLLSAVPLIGHLLAPRRYAQIREWLNKAFLPEPRTELALMRNSAKSGGAVSGLLTGFAAEEKADRVASVLVPAGLSRGFARLVVVLGHGSTSLNNPHESAHDCGACGGRRGGPNARLFAAMANRTEVRELLGERGVEIPGDTWFIGGYHDTCTDEVELYDVEAVPATHQADLERIRESLEKARAGDARERARRFESCAADATPEHALRHVEERAEHLAQPRPEYGHCTNAICIVGRRSLTRGLFLDRRAFLSSYDASQDPDDQSLAAVLAAVVPVCAGISLEYYFSFVDNDRYGCGTKLPHNVAGLVGVMDGHASDLRTGLPWQMVEIHEPVRCLFVVETTPERLIKVVNADAGIKRLVENRWIRIAAIDPETGRIHICRDGGFEEFDGVVERLPAALSSPEWYGGKIEHLAMAEIQAGAGAR